MKIFVTGATGVVGRRLVPLLIDAGHEVTALARSAEGRSELQRRGAGVVDLNLFDPAAVRRAVEGHDAVVNLATHIPYPAWRMFFRSAWRENDRLRRIASATLVDASLDAGVSRFIQESFAPVYPDRGDQWIDETAPLRTVRYNHTVSDAEAAANRFTQRGGTGIVLRFGGFYGPDAFQTSEMIKYVRAGWAPLPGSADAFLSSISHDDAATAAATALTLPAGTYNVVDDEPVTHREFFDSLARVLGVRPPKLPPRWVAVLFGSLGELMCRSVRVSNRKLRESSGWMPIYRSVREGWREVVKELSGPLESQSVRVEHR